MKKEPVLKQKVAIVDDDVPSLKILFDLLEQDGYQVLAFQSVTQALAQLPTINPHLILMDVRMDEMDGFEACRIIKTNPAMSGIPIIFVTMLDDIDSLVRAFDLGAADYILKPIRRAELLARIHSHLTLSLIKQQIEEKNAQLEKEINLRLENEKILQEKETKLRRQALIFNHLFNAIMILDAKGKIVEWNPAATELFGYEKEPLIGKTLDQLTLPADRPFLDNEILRNFASQGAWIGSRVILTKDGDEVVCEISLQALREGSRGYSTIIGIFRDVTEKKRMEEALHESEERFRSVGASTQEGIIVIDPEGMISFWNPAAEKIFGYSAGEVNNKEIHSLLFPSQLNSVESSKKATTSWEWFKLLRPGATQEVNAQRKDGLQITIEVSLSTMQIRRKTHGILTIRDSSERRHLKERLMAAEKLADIGALAAGTANEINSPIQVVLGTSQRLLEHAKLGSVDPLYVSNNIETITQNAWRVADIVRSLRSFMLAPTQNFSMEDVNRIVQDAYSMVQKEFQDSQLDVVFSFGKNLPPWRCDRSQIIQLLINITKNAVEATQEGGKITFQTNFVPKHHKIIISVSDSGHGIPTDARLRIFDPFFTTKPMGKGMGLGLTIVQGIVRSHQGDIRVETEEGKGTEFIVSFPLDITQLISTIAP